ncbi:hypothetical protein [Streptomyces sp. NBC_01803]|uniref:hypothetical protein n=1 Tax=Streptomyces sp. NBC_01803 TaxID=2975946 RepID=UPI002DDBF6F7|nr:hypothetical protein [Streptomyces sp. NBC_01803]WSA47318.1 hypothetical protein OIE51_25990 [Streptomyces sp. NBC_01803]
MPETSWRLRTDRPRSPRGRSPRRNQARTSVGRRRVEPAGGHSPAAVADALVTTLFDGLRR